LAITAEGSAITVELGQAETGRYVIEATTDFAEWSPVTTNNVVDGRMIFVDPPATNRAVRLYRAVPAR
jgi:hypothetical protein